MKLLDVFLATCCLVVFAISQSPNVAFAQSAPKGVAGQGEAESSAMASVLRMKVTLEAKAADMEQTIALLRKKQKQATIRLEKTGASEDSIVAGPIGPSASGDSAEVMAQFKRMLGDDPRLAEVEKVTPPVTLQLELTCDWKLDAGESTTDILVQSIDIKTKAAKADVGCKDIDNNLSEAQEEVAEEMQSIMSEYGRGNSSDAGALSFSYIRKISAEEHQQLVQQAFADAKKKAQALAQVASRNLGEVLAISTSSASSPIENVYYDHYGGGSSVDEASIEELDDGALEISSTKSPAVDHSVKVSVLFELAK